MEALGAKKILVNDLDNLVFQNFGKPIENCSKEKIFEEADVISLHVPLTKKTYGMISKKEMMKMKKNACIINTSRGGVVNETDLTSILKVNPNFKAAIDVFEEEPYTGE